MLAWVYNYFEQKPKSEEKNYGSFEQEFNLRGQRVPSRLEIDFSKWRISLYACFEILVYHDFKYFIFSLSFRFVQYYIQTDIIISGMWVKFSVRIVAIRIPLYIYV